MLSCICCLSPTHSDSHPPKQKHATSPDMDGVTNQRNGTSLNPRSPENTPEDINQNRPRNQVKKVDISFAPPSYNSGDNLGKETEGDEKIELKSENDSSDGLEVEDPFNPKYELWRVISSRAKVKIHEHRKSKKICELTRGTVVRCVARAPRSVRFRIDLPLVGWCSFSHARVVAGTDDNQPLFDRVDPSVLPVLDSRFVLELKVGQGSFGKVYVAWDRKKNRKVALKIDQPKGGKRSVFDREIAIMKVVSKCKNVPSLLYCGCVSSHTQRGKYIDKEDSYEGLQYMIMDLQGLSLSILKKNYLTLFSLKTVLMLGIVIVKVLRQVHELGVLHRDIKPANFVVSRGDQGRNINILDFGLSVMYKRSDGSHVEYREGCRRCGTARYSSINTHKRIRQSRRDDLEAAGYVLLLFLRDLPWKQQKGESPEKKWKRILSEKQRWTPTELCSGLSPSVGKTFCEYFDYCRKLRYSAKPNYNKLVTLFKSTLEKNDEEVDFVYDWVKFL